MHALVTGASNGIGFHTALCLASDYGYTVVALSRNEKRLKILVKEAQRSTGGRVIPLAMDLLAGDWKKMTAFLKKQGMAHIDALIHNAGKLVNKPFGNLAAEDWRSVYTTNVFAPAELTRRLLPLLGGVSQTHIVNIGSYGGFQGTSKFPGLAAYSSSKAALANLSECLAEEFKDRNIRVNCLALGAVQTDMLQQAFPGYTAPLSPKKMGEFIAWFAAKGAAFFNGKVLPVALAGR